MQKLRGAWMTYIMSNTLIKLAEVIDEISMGPFGSDIKVENFVQKGVPVLNGSNLIGFKLVEDDFKYVTAEKAKSYKKAIARKGDIIVTHRGTLGQISYIPDDSKYQEYVISQSQFRVRFKNSKAHPPYVVFYFHTSEGQKRLLSFKNHVGVPALAQATTNFRQLEIPLPDINTQKKVSSLLTKLDSKIEANNKINAELEKIAKTIYDYWFVQFDFPDENGRPYKSNGGKMVWSDELNREIPEGWETCELGEIITINRGTSYTSKDIGDNKGKPFLNLDSFYLDGNYKEEGIKFYSGAHRDNKSLVPGDLIIAATDVTRNADIIGKSFLVPDIFNGNKIYFSMDLAQLKLSNKVSKHYLRLLFNSEYYHKYIKYFATGTLVLHLNIDGVKKFKIPKPPEIIFQKFDSIMNNIEIKKSIIIKENRILINIRDWLLPMLMNGQVTIKDEN